MSLRVVVEEFLGVLHPDAGDVSAYKEHAALFDDPYSMFLVWSRSSGVVCRVGTLMLVAVRLKEDADLFALMFDPDDAAANFESIGQDIIDDLMGAGDVEAASVRAVAVLAKIFSVASLYDEALPVAEWASDKSAVLFL